MSADPTYFARNKASLTRQRVSAFSLIELLVVVAILSILMVLTLPAISSLMQSSDLTRAGQMLTDQINLARQIASAHNTVTEVRLIELQKNSGYYTGIQIWRADPAGQLKAVKPVVVLPQAMAISGNSGHSAAISSLTEGTMPAGGVAGSAKYRALQIRPSGFITPTVAMNSLFFTVMPESKTANAGLPPNYFMLQVNPLTGAALVYRP